MFDREEEKNVLVSMLSLIVEVSIIFMVLFIGMSLS